MVKSLILLITCCTLSAADHTVALTILAEARGEGLQGMAAVACVISQRAKDRGITPKEVCLQRKQFSCWNGKTEADLAHLHASEMAPWALYLEKSIMHMNRAKIGYADHYYADYVKPPYWATGQQPVAKIGRHIFFKLNKNERRAEYTPNRK